LNETALLSDSREAEFVTAILETYTEHRARWNKMVVKASTAMFQLHSGYQWQVASLCFGLNTQSLSTSWVLKASWSWMKASTY